MLLRKKLAGLLVVACLGLLGTAAEAGKFDKIQDGITVSGIDVSGMTYDEAKDLIQKKVSDLRNAKITVQVGEHEVETTAAELGLKWKNKRILKEAATIGNSGNIISRYKTKKDLQATNRQYELDMRIDEEKIRAFIADECLQYEKPRVESSIASDGNGGIDLKVGQDGLKIDVEESVGILEDYLLNQLDEDGGEIAISVKVDAVASKEDIETITDKLGSFTTYYGSTYGRDINVERGAELINGHLLKPGESFSVCDHLVPFNAENGYELGGAYENGRVVQEYGGGICQVSTTLYNALLLAEVQIDERHNHTMSVTYVPTSMDAAIAEGNFDLVFTNNYETPIFISGYAYGGELTFTVWGKDTRPRDREIWFESFTTGELEAPTNTVLLPADDKEAGYFQQVQVAQPGSTAVCYKYISYQGQTDVEVVNESTYEATPNTYEVGTLGANQTLLNAIYNDDVATAQLAATGQITIGTGAGVGTTDLQPILDPIRNIYVDPMTGQPIPGQNSIYSPGYQEPVYQEPAYGEVYYDTSTVYYE